MSAEKGYADAQTNLGYAYYKGQGTERDCRLAVRWYRKAAKQDALRAIRNLALCYANGTGVRRDPRKAEALFERYRRLKTAKPTNRNGG